MFSFLWDPTLDATNWSAEHALPGRRGAKAQSRRSAHDGDQPYYDAFANTSARHTTFVTDNSLDRFIDSGNVDYVMRRIREDHYDVDQNLAFVWPANFTEWAHQRNVEAGVLFRASAFRPVNSFTSTDSSNQKQVRRLPVLTSTRRGNESERQIDYRRVGTRADGTAARTGAEWPGD